MNKETSIEANRVMILCSGSLKDALAMMVASHRLMTMGSRVVTFHDELCHFKAWFEDHTIEPYHKFDIDEAASTDLILVQYSQEEGIEKLITCLREYTSVYLSVFFTKEPKNFPMCRLDCLLDRHRPIVDNIAFAVSSLLRLKNHSKNNGLIAPNHLIHRKNLNQVILEYTDETFETFEKLAKLLSEKGFSPLLLKSPSADLIYESGFFIGHNTDALHLASNLHIPNFALAPTGGLPKLRRPGWLSTRLITPKNWFLSKGVGKISAKQILAEFLKHPSTGCQLV